MPVFPQYQGAVALTQGATFIRHTAASTSSAAANSGDVHIYNSAATGWPLTLPPVGLGGPVKVVNIHATGTILVTPNETSGVTVNGGASYTIPSGGTGAAATSATFFSDGVSAWFAS